MPSPRRRGRRATGSACADDDHWLACLPLSHVGGLSVVTRALHTGTRLTVLPGFDAAAVEGREPPSSRSWRRRSPASTPSRFRTIVLGGSRPPDDRPANCVTTYGMTETGSGVVYDGVPLDGVEVDITADGEIRLRAPMLLRCYRDGTRRSTTTAGSPPATSANGDLTVALHVAGRRGDLIITGGENVWPEAVEAALADHPSVAEVMVRGVDDPEWGQLVEAVIVPAGDPPTLESLRGHVKRRHPASWPPSASPLVESQLPRTATSASSVALRAIRRCAGCQPAATPAPPSMT